MGPSGSCLLFTSISPKSFQRERDIESQKERERERERKGDIESQRERDIEGQRKRERVRKRKRFSGGGGEKKKSFLFEVTLRDTGREDFRQNEG